jgi:hypothetical protein
VTQTAAAATEQTIHTTRRLQGSGAVAIGVAFSVRNHTQKETSSAIHQNTG